MVKNEDNEKERAKPERMMGNMTIRSTTGEMKCHL